jgi:hypothetical protein
MGEVDLRLDFVGSGTARPRLCGGLRFPSGTSQPDAHFFRFIFF